MPTPLFFHDANYKGIGISAGLARGLQVKMEGIDLTQEGMGLGAIAIRSGGKTYFAKDSRIVWSDPHRIVQDYVIDTAHLAGIGGPAAPWINQFREVLSAFYRVSPLLQKPMLETGLWLRRWLGIKTYFTPVAPQARAQFQLHLHPNKIEVRCEFQAIGEPPQELYIMNELGADFFNSSWRAGQTSEPPRGWQVCAEPHNLPFLHSPQSGARYSLRDISVDNGLPFKVCWGREKLDNLCWAGFAIKLSPAAAALNEIVCCYTIIFEND